MSWNDRIVMGSLSSAAEDPDFPPLNQTSPQIENGNATAIEAEEEELFVAMGNAAKAARRNNSVSVEERKATAEFTTTSSSLTTAFTIADNVERIAAGVDDGVGGGGGGELNEDCTTMTGLATTTTTRSNVGNVVADYGDDCEKQAYVGSGASDYKTNGTATLSQSELKIQQQQEPDENLAPTTTTATFVGPFLDQTWNWVHYAIVTLLFLNLVKICGKIWSAISCGEADTFGPENCAEVKVSGETDAPVEKSETCTEKGTMSPNTCSIQNQEEVEKAEEAIMAVGPQPSGEVASKQGEGKNVELQQQQVTIVLSSTDEDDSGNLASTRRDSVDSFISSEGSGNLADVEICDKSSSEDGASSENGDAGKTTEEVTQKIIAQVESMFSDDHLAKDGFLLKHVRRRSDGFVSLKLVAGLRKVKQISREFPVVLNALKDSSKLEVNSEGTKVRRVEPLSTFLKSLPIKSKEKEPKEKDGSSNEENQQPNVNANIKSASKSGNKENNENGSRAGSRRNSGINMGGNTSRRNSNALPGAHLPGSRHSSFSKGPGLPPTGHQHPADLFRNVCMTAYSSSGEENQSPQVGRRRGGSLPIAALQHRASHSGAYLSPNSSPPNATGTLILGPNGARPKSNSCCEGASPTSMSPWLQRRKASATSARLSNGELIFSGVIRQPRGPDGTKGFASGYRAMILEERLQQPQNSAVSA